jgi:hypothetical protein
MNERDPAIHALEVTPKCFCRIYGERVCYRHPDYEDAKDGGCPRKLRAILFISQHKESPASEGYLNENAKGETFSSDEWKEEVIRYIERYEGNYKECSERTEPHNF